MPADAERIKGEIVSKLGGHKKFDERVREALPGRLGDRGELLLDQQQSGVGEVELLRELARREPPRCGNGECCACS